jgi:hypothetical protein
VAVGDAQNSKPTVGKPFAKGQSGNPGGRPAVAREFRKRCREFMEQEGGGWDELISLAKDRKAKEQRYALELIAAYAYGRPKQGVELSGPDGAPVALDIDTASLVRKARELAAKADGGK